jgi:hypothetical protein
MTVFNRIRFAVSLLIALAPCVQAYTAQRAPIALSNRVRSVPVMAVRDPALLKHHSFRHAYHRMPWHHKNTVIKGAHKTYLQAFKAAVLAKKRE